MNPDTSISSPLLTEAEAAAMLRLAPATLRGWRCAGRGPGFVKIGGRVCYRRSDIEAFIAAGERNAAGISAE
jgi:predicted DNA-binding transcriptional regulator AlpA